MTALFKNKTWSVTDYGLESIRNVPLGLTPEEGFTPPYEIAAKRLLETTSRGGTKYYEWPVHMTEKTWVDIEDFIEAFSAALKIHAGKYEGPADEKMLQASFALARKETRRR